jgi:hypothetical protein
VFFSLKMELMSMDDLFDSSDDEAPAPTIYNTYPRTEELECM